MRMVWILIFLLVCFGIVGRIDYESAMAMDEFRLPAANTIMASRAAAQWDDE